METKFRLVTTVASAFLAAFFVFAMEALAADRFLGRLVSYDGGQMVMDNYTTSSSTSFLQVPKASLLSIQCTENSYVNVFPDAGTVPSIRNTVKVPQDALFTTSATAATNYVIAKPVSVVPDAGCVVFERMGNE